MPEPLDETVRRRMQRQRRRDTPLELEIRKQLHALGFRYRVDFRLDPPLRTRADICFTKQKVAVFIDGCFWHGCPQHATSPKNNAAWWREKLDANIARDRRTDADLDDRGWQVIRIWEHEVADEAVVQIVAQLAATNSA
ncbi:MAG: very short patch repair endonuclease [Pseudonocardiaceae bacterium]